MAKAGDGRVQFGPPGKGKEAAARPARGRTCLADGCSTVLSTYNDSEMCWLHSPPSYRKSLSRG